MRRPVASRGRPKKEGEVLSIERPIKFAPSMYERLKAVNEETGVSIAEQVRRAVAKDLAGQSEPATPPPDALTIHINPEEQEELRKFIRPFGYRVLEHFIEDCALRALDKSPRAVQEYLLGEFLRVGEEAEAKERARLQALAEERKANEHHGDEHKKGKAA